MPRAKIRDTAKKKKKGKKEETGADRCLNEGFRCLIYQTAMLDDVDELDAGPSPEDLRRFGGETACCPQCGVEVWDQAEVCPACGAYLAGATTSRPPRRQALRRRLLMLAALLALVALILAIVL